MKPRTTAMAPRGFRARLRQRWFNWLDRRSPPRDQQRLNRHNLYIFFSSEGGLFALLLVIMLLTGINYQNSLIYLLAFLLGALFFAGITQTHQNLAGLTLTLVEAGEGFAGEPLGFRLRVHAQDGRARPGLRFFWEGGETGFDLPAGEHRDLTMSVRPPRRGPVTPPRLGVETRFPFGLLRAWSWLRFQRTGLAFPRPLPPPHAMLGQVEEGEETTRPVTSALGDASSLRPYRLGDSLARVQWKRFSRSGEMVVLEWESPAGDPRWLDFDAFPGADTELRLSYLAYEVERLTRLDQPFGLILPGWRAEPGRGSQHRLACLRRLAEYQPGGRNGPG